MSRGIRGTVVVAAFVAVLALCAWTVIDLNNGSTGDAGQAATLPPKSTTEPDVDEPPTFVTVERPDDRPLRVLIAGDSLAAGYFATTVDRGFSQLLMADLEQDGPARRVGGQQAGGDTATVAGLVSVESDLDLAIIELGTNDQFKPAPVERVGRNYAKLVEKVRAKSPDVPLVCVGPWLGDDSRGLGAEIRDVCWDADGVYVPLIDVFNAVSSRGPAGRKVETGVSDDFHPNDAGHERIAERLLDVIRVES